MRSFGTSQARGRRSVPRTQVPVVSVLATSTGDYRAALIDLSRTGARVVGEFLPAVGELLTFKAAEVQACGEVVWREANVCALEFQTPIAVNEVLRIRSLGAVD